MARISMDRVCLTFRVRQHQRVTFKEFMVKRLFRRSGNKPNICNQRGQLDPEGAPGSYFPGRTYHLS